MDHRLEIVSSPREHVMGEYRRLHVQVPARDLVIPLFPEPRYQDAHPGVDTGRHADLHPPRRLGRPPAPAFTAGGLRDPSFPAAHTAGGRGGIRESSCLLPSLPPGSPATGALTHIPPGAPRPGTGNTPGGVRDLDLPLASPDRLCEGHGYLHQDIGGRSRPELGGGAPGLPPEEGIKGVAKPLKAPGVTAAPRRGRPPRIPRVILVAEAVIPVAFPGVREHPVGLVDPPEPVPCLLLVADIGVEPHREGPVGLLDLPVRGSPRHPENFVVGPGYPLQTARPLRHLRTRWRPPSIGGPPGGRSTSGSSTGHPDILFRSVYPPVSAG